MNRYEKAQIYFITDIAYTKFYYGSTIEPLKKRMERHRQKYHRYKEGKYHFFTSFLLFDEFGIDNCKIAWVEDCPCSCKKELEAREGYFHRNNDCVNKIIAGRPRQEYLEQSKESRSKRHKEYLQENRDYFAQKAKEYSEKHSERLKEVFDCGCGGKYQHRNRTGHFKTKLHQDWVNQQNTE